ncbi:hypothetical protein [Fibrella forsythiae]|uniref:Uncharacterized protein n=1 Tax=Fibrella forsythiae TaxID=2817061 RepID=A0ABS3JNZ2_9BACT|nr:hypothetical protein [Fibrella forsythiae]MBO0951715.1 hypothetical protein [Fibrella forsythiae]
MKKLVLILLLGSALSACKKDEVVSFGQQTATRIQAELPSSTSTTRIARVYIGTAQVEYGVFSFAGDFIVVDGVRFNLNRLVSYEVFSSGSTPILNLYF